MPHLLYSGITMKLISMVSFAVLGIALAQGPQPADFSALKSYLNLTDAQIRQMQQAREKAAKDADEKERTVRPQIQEKRSALADLLEKDAADPTAVGRMMLDIRGLERQIRAAHEAVRTAEVNVMNPEQKAKFRAIQDAANLPAATLEAQRLGLVPGQPQGPGPRPRMQGPMVGPGRIGLGDNGPQMRPGQGPGPGPAQPMAPPPGPPRQGDPEGGR
jgi:Spy/CpxP family protein refolding chaperone